MNLGKIHRTALSLSMLVVGCGPPEPFTGQVSQSEFFTYHNEDKEALCPSLLSRLDEYVRFVLKEIGAASEASRPHFRYYKFHDEESYQEKGPCADTGGCAIEDSVYSPLPFHAHEIAHVVTYYAWGGQSMRFLSEGEAVAISCEPSEPSSALPPAGTSDWRQYLNIDAVPNGYHVAGTFVTHLATMYGWDKVGELHRSVGNGESADQLAAEFARIFSLPLDTAWANAMSDPQAPSCFTSWMCNGGPVVPSASISLDCDGDTHQRIEMAGHVGVVLELGDSNVSLARCDVPEPLHVLAGGNMFSVPGVTHLTALPPGSYSIEYRAAQPMKNPRVISYLDAGFVAPECNSAPELSLAQSEPSMIDLPVGTLTGWARIAAPGVTGTVTRTSSNGVVKLCEDCTGASCIEISTGQVVSLPPTTFSVIYLDNVVAFPSDSLTFFPKYN